MPGFDGTGPLGRGPMTGWSRGRCIGKIYPASQQEPAKESGAGGTEQIPVQPDGRQGPGLYGLGRGGIPMGCGRGFCGGLRGGRDRARGGGMRGGSE